MNNYLDDRHFEVKQLHNIFSKEFPEFLIPFFDAKEIKRLHKVWQNCWSDYCKFFNYKQFISRLDHSVGVALIIYNFTKDPKQTLAWLFHDISHAVFWHSADFSKWDALTQSSSEIYVDYILENSEIISRELNNLWISLDEVRDYTIYPIADNHAPMLSSDRLEYTLATSFLRTYVWDIDKVSQVYNDIAIVTNEIWEIELWFNNINLAKDFAILSVKNCSTQFSSYDAITQMAILWEILKLVVQKWYYTELDLYKITESEIIDFLTNSKDYYLNEFWKFYTTFDKYKIHDVKPDTENFVFSTVSKKRYIDPLVKTENWTIRISQLDNEISQLLINHKNSNKIEKFIEIDFPKSL